MTLPTKLLTWTHSVNQRVTFVSVLQCTQDLLFAYKQFAKNTHSATITGSCDGTTGAKDGVDRWATAANAGTRGAAAGNAQSWVIWKDANNVETLLCFQGATDDRVRISYSPGALFVVAGTPNQQPTATDEVVVCTTAVSWTDITASGDRVWHGWSDSTKKNLMFVMARQSVTTHWWGVVEATKEVDAAVTWNGVYGIMFSGVGLTATSALFTYSVNASARRTRVVIGGTPFTIDAVGGMEMYNSTVNSISDALPELQGGVGYPIIPMKLGSTTVSAKGRLGFQKDIYAGRMAGANPGDVYGTNDWVTLGAAGWVLPWNGTTVPVWL